MLGTKRRAPPTIDHDTDSRPASQTKRTKTSHQSLDPLAGPPPQSTTEWIWQTVKNLIRVPAPPSEITRQKPLRLASTSNSTAFSPFKDLSDDWIWRTMNAKQRGQPPPEEPDILKQIRIRQERLLHRQTPAGAYQKKKPMGSKQNLPTPSTSSRQRRRRLPTPEFLRNTSTTTRYSNESTSSIEKHAHRKLFDFITQSLPVASNRPASSSSSSDTPSDSSCDSVSSDSSSCFSPSASPHPSAPPSRTPILVLSSSPTPSPSPPRTVPPHEPLLAPAVSFFASPWLPESLRILERKQHRLALQTRDLSTLESLRSIPSTSTSDEKDNNFRVYREGVKNLVRQQDAEQDSRPRNTSSLLGPPSTTYASILSSSSSSTLTRPRHLSRVDRTLENYHKTQTESPGKRILDPKPGSKAQLFAEFQKLRVRQEQEEQRALAAEAELDLLSTTKEEEEETVRPQRRRKWPLKVPREIQDRVSQILAQANSSKGYEKSIPGASVDTKAIKRLRPGTWLDDSIVGFYQVLINNRFDKSLVKASAEENGKTTGGGGGGPREMRLKKVWCFNSFFWNMYRDNGYKRVKKWTKKFDAFEKDILIMPINIRNSHWTCAAINLRLKRFEYYDSLGNRMDSAYTQMRKWLQEEHECKKGGPIDLSDWEDYWDPDVPQQDNCNDCGVFTCCFMESLSREVEGFDFDQTQMPYLRQKIAYEIDRAELLAEEFE